MECLFEVIGDVTVRGPFGAGDDVPEGSREAILQGVRLEVSRRVAEAGADAAMVRELIYDPDSAVAETSIPEIIAVEGILLSFVDSGLRAGWVGREGEGDLRGPWVDCGHPGDRPSVLG